MAVSDVAIANLALVSLGADTIMSLDEDSENARKINAVYELIRDEVLRAHPWNFAIKRAQLAQLSETPTFGYTYAYQLPTDCLKVLRLNDEDADYRIEQGKLYTDLSSVKIEYIARITDPTKFDSAFVSAFAARLAAEVAYAITSSLQLQQLKWKEYREKLNQAKALDSQEGKPQVRRKYNWIESRK